MSKSTLGNWLLTLGMVMGGISAANSDKAGVWKNIEAGQALPGEYLLHPVTVDGQEAPLVEADSPLDAATVGRLAAAGIERVQVRNPTRPNETIAVADEALAGRVLDEAVMLSFTTTTLKRGERLTPKNLLDLRAAEIETVPVADGELPVSDGSLVGEELTADLIFQLPERLPAGTFLGPEQIERLRSAGIQEATARINREFTFGGWQLAWMFALAVIAMVSGVALKRSDRAGSGSADDETSDIGLLKRHLRELSTVVDGLAERADELADQEISSALDPLFTDRCIPFVEGRQAIAIRHGIGTFTEVLSAFSSGERWLNRAWSAAVDRNVEEARLSLREAAPKLRDALAALP